jgi:heterodisulfide reductase subunit B
MLRYALFLGCTIPVRALNYEISARKVADKLQIKLIDINEFNCCGFPLKSVDRDTFLLMATKNLSLAEEKGLNICCLCSACTSVLTEVNKELKEDKGLMKKINRGLSVLGRKYEGGVKVRHFLGILYKDIGPDRIREDLKVDLSKFNLAAHYGCHYLKPSEIYEGFDDPENPETLDKLIEITGAKSIFYEDKGVCCGGGILGIDELTALKIAKGKLDHIKSAKADAICLVCPFCSIMYEGSQKRIERQFEVEYNLPVLYYPQILGLALGISQDQLGFKINRVKPKKMLEKIPVTKNSFPH